MCVRSRDSVIFTHSGRWQFGAPANLVLGNALPRTFSRSRSSCANEEEETVGNERRRRRRRRRRHRHRRRYRRRRAFTCDHSLSARSLPLSPRNRFPR